MRILILTEYLPISDRGEITGGVEAYCHYVGGHMREAGHDVEFISRRTDGSVWEHASMLSVPGRIAFLLRGLVQGLRADADVVMGTTYVVHPLAWLVARIRRRPVVFWYPDVLIGTWRSGQFGRVAGIVGEAMERALLKLPVDRYIAISHSTATKLERQGIPRDRISVIPCGYDPDVLEAVRPEAAPVPRIVSVGRLVGYKRPDVILRAFARLARDRGDLQLIMVGQGPERPRLESLAAQLGVSDRVELRGFVDRHTDVLALIAGARAFVSASEIEGFGIVLVEAMAMGTPYVATDIPAFREVTDGGAGGALFPAGDDAALAGALAPILDDPDHHERLAAAGRRRSAEFRWTEVATETAAQVADLIDNH